MKKRVFVSILCLIMICTFIGPVGHAEELEPPNNTRKIIDQDDIQYYVKWDASREPDDISITEEEYLAYKEKDKNENGILDILEEELEEDEVRAAAFQTGVLGDLNGDSLVDNRDVVLLYRYFANWEQDILDDVLDFNGDGYTNISDAHHLLKYVSKWPDTELYKGKKYDIIYHLYSEDMFIPKEGILNVNPDYYCVSEGLTLKSISSVGYVFEGWYDGEGENATRITKIAAGETGEIELYARWTPKTYQILFDSSMVEVETKYYTIETGATLTNPSLSNYTFVGWTKQEDGRFVKGVPKGSTGNLTLVANWAARRNQTKPVSRLADPIILEDTANGKIMFLYELGEIQNIPLFELLRFNTAQGISSTVQFTERTSMTQSDAQTISRAVTAATTDSGSWTLSEGWSDTTNVSEETLMETGLTREEAETIAKSSTDTYRFDTSVGQSEVVTDSSQHTYKGTLGTGGSEAHQTATANSFKYSVDTEDSLEATVGASIGVEKVAEVNASTTAKDTIKIGEESETTANRSSTTTDTWNATIENSGQKAKTRTSSKNWNTTSSYSNSNTLSNSVTTSEQISELIANKYGYGQSYSKNGAHSSGQTFTIQDTQQNVYSNTVTYDRSTLHEQVVSYTANGTMDGYYRLVAAGTAHVFGVVGYDVATRSYFTYMYTVMDDNVYEFLDYSKNDPSFSDNEIGVIPFEIPVFVNEYVNAKIAKSDGLEININTGKVTGYTGDDPIVVVPSYRDVYNGDGTYSSVKVTGIDANAFRGNTSIQGVIFSEFITEIPDSAFEGCTSLRDVYIPSLTSIGNRAFYGCTSLSTMTIPEDVVSIGADAFHDVEEIRITAANKNVALAAINSGAKSLVLNIASIEEAMDNTEFVVSSGMNVFELQGGRKDYRNLRVKSFSGTTRINGVNFVDCLQVPLELHSSSVDLNQVTASGSGYCMIIAADNCELSLFGINRMISSGGNAIVCGNISLSNTDSSVQALLEVSGNIYVCGSIANSGEYLSLTNGNIITITQDEYEMYISGVYQLIFNPNGGSVTETERTAYSGNAIGELPIPTRTGYTFAGWYTALSGGTQVTPQSTFFSTGSVTVYALWTANDYTVSFNGNGGTPSIASKTVYYNSTYGNLATATRTGYTFDGWYTAASGGSKVESTTSVTATSDHTLYAHWRAGAYTVSFNGNGGTASAASMTVYYGSTYGSLATATRIGYTFTGWYTAASGGSKVESTTSVTATSNHMLYAHWTANPYTYSIVYKSINGTDLGTDYKTYNYGTTNTITPPAKTGYDTPAAQTVAWDSTSGKTITFTYPVTPAPNSQSLFTGTWWQSSSSSSKITYAVTGEWQNRTSNSIQVKITWTNTISGGYYGYTQKYSVECLVDGSTVANTGTLQIASSTKWPSSSSPNKGSATKDSGWITVPINTGTTSITIKCNYWDANQDKTISNSFTIPAY